MKALSVKMPWWSRIELGHKTLEVRTWTTKHRGPLLICASLNTDLWGMRNVGLGVAGLMRAGSRMGHAICIVDLVDCRPMVKADEGVAMVPYREGLFVWVLRNPRPTLEVPVKGRLGLFEVAL